MNIIKIVVDELPDSCSKCWFTKHAEFDFADRWWCEGVNEKPNDIDDPATRPDWCPLEIEKVTHEKT